MDIPFIRITVVGAQGVGKTRFIDSYVNNTLIADQWYGEPTTAPKFFFRQVLLEPKAELAFRGKQTPCLLEIEDTPPTSFCNLRESEAIQAHGFEDLKLMHPSIQYVKFDQVNRLYLNEAVANPMPFSIMDYHRTIHQDGTVEEKALTQGRMGFAVVFSLTDPDSFDEAVEIHTSFGLIQERYSMPVRPVVVLVGNKLDIAGRPEHASLRRRAEAYAGLHNLPLFSVSAKSGHGLREAITEIAAQVYLRPVLWYVEILGRPKSDEAEDSNDEDVEE